MGKRKGCLTESCSCRHFAHRYLHSESTVSIPEAALPSLPPRKHHRKCFTVKITSVCPWSLLGLDPYMWAQRDSLPTVPVTQTCLILGMYLLAVGQALSSLGVSMVSTLAKEPSKPAATCCVLCAVLDAGLSSAVHSVWEGSTQEVDKTI